MNRIEEILKELDERSTLMKETRKYLESLQDLQEQSVEQLKKECRGEA